MADIQLIAFKARCGLASRLSIKKNRRATLEVAVVMHRERVLGRPSRWQTWRWVLAEVVKDDASFGTAPRLLLKNDEEERWLHPGFKVELLETDAEG